MDGFHFYILVNSRVPKWLILGFFVCLFVCFASYFHRFCGKFSQGPHSTIPEVEPYVALYTLAHNSLWGDGTLWYRCLRQVDWAS